MRYEQATVGWLADVLVGVDWKVSPLEAIETERRYPGLMADLGIELWQRKLIKDQMAGDTNPTNAELDGLE